MYPWRSRSSRELRTSLSAYTITKCLEIGAWTWPRALNPTNVSSPELSNSSEHGQDICPLGKSDATATGRRSPYMSPKADGACSENVGAQIYFSNSNSSSGFICVPLGAVPVGFSGKRHAHSPASFTVRAWACQSCFLIVSSSHDLCQRSPVSMIDIHADIAFPLDWQPRSLVTSDSVT